MQSVNWAILLMIGACSGAAAGDFPKEGTASYTTNYVNVSATPMKMGERTASIYESAGITRNDAGEAAYSDEAGRGFRFEAGRHSEAKPATGPI